MNNQTDNNSTVLSCDIVPKQNFISNGDFQYPQIATNANWSYFVPRNISGWISQQSEVGRGYYYNDEWGNTQVIQLDGDKFNINYTQQFNLKKGYTYRFQLQAAARQNRSIESSGFQVVLNSIRIIIQNPHQDFHVRNYSYTFICSSQVNKIQIKGLGIPDNDGTTVDNVNLTEIDGPTYPNLVQGQCRCKDGYFHNDDGKCSPCSMGSFGCLQCNYDLPFRCKKCVNEYPLKDYFCSCANGSFPSRTSNACVLCSVINTLCLECTNENEFTCTLCQNGYYPEKTSCLPCSNVHFACSKCKSQTECTKCENGFELVDGKCLCESPTTFHDFTEQKCLQCTQMDDHCQKCHSVKGTPNVYKCEQCVAKYYPSNSECLFCNDTMTGCVTCSVETVLKCTLCDEQNNYFKQTHKNNCTLCSLVGCLDCDSLAECSDCNESDQYFLNPSTKVCWKCSISQCLRCDDFNKCQSCNQSNAFFMNDVFHCEKCELEGCKVCQSLIECFQCDNQENYFKETHKDNCTLCSLVGCLDCESLTECSECNENNQYFLNPSTKVCWKCHLDNCLQCDDFNKCEICNETNSFYLNTQFHCEKCEMEGCRVCQTLDECFKCDQTKNYFKEIAKTNCTRCTLVGCLDCESLSQCFACNESGQYFLNPSTNVCWKCDIDNCLKCNAFNKCETCNETNFFYLNTEFHCEKCELKGCKVCQSLTKCFQCEQQNDYFKETHKDNCTLCSLVGCLDCESLSECSDCNESGQYFLNPSTKVCWKCSISECLHCESFNKCQSCNQSNAFFMNDVFHCEKCELEGCEICQSLIECFQCDNQENYFKETHKDNCTKCSLVGCLDCDSLTECSECNENNQYFLNPSTNLCWKCDLDNCLQCDDFNKCEICNESNAFFINYMFHCEKCELEGCLLCSSLSECIQCDRQSNYLLSPTTQQCYQCSLEGCILCFNDFECEKCGVGFEEQPNAQLLCEPRIDCGTNNSAITKADYQKQECDDLHVMSRTATAIVALSYITMGVSLFSGKIVGLELFGVLQVAFFSLAHQPSVNLFLSPLLDWRYVNGYNLPPSYFQNENNKHKTESHKNNDLNEHNQQNEHKRNEHNQYKRNQHNEHNGNKHFNQNNRNQSQNENNETENIHNENRTTRKLLSVGNSWIDSPSEVLSDQVPPNVAAIAYSHSFIDNTNVMLFIMIAELFFAAILLFLSDRFPFLRRVGNFMAKELFVTLFLFNCFNISFSLGLHFTYADSDNTERYILSTSFAFFAIFCCFVAIVELLCLSPIDFGEFKLKFKGNFLNQNYIVFSIVFRIVLGFFMAIANEIAYGNLIVLSIALFFLIYFCVNLPFLQTLHNYRAFVIHSTVLLILLIANFYTVMKYHDPKVEVARIFTPAKIQIVLLIICVVLSVTVLLSEIYICISKYSRSSGKKIKDSNNGTKLPQQDKPSMYMSYFSSQTHTL